METKGNLSKGTRILVTAASFVILVAGMRAASSIIVPFLLSVFLATICSPPLFWMQRKSIPKPLAVLSILIGIIAIGFLMVVFVGTSLNGLSSALPVYQERLAEMTATFFSRLKGLGLDVSYGVLTDYFDTGKIASVAGNTLTGLRGVLKNIFLILLMFLFLLLEASGFPNKLRAVVKDPEDSIVGLSKFTENLNRYLAIKTLFSILTGVIIWGWLCLLRVDYPLLWGLLAFMLNYVPSIGSIIAAIPAVILALIQLGTGSALLTCLGYIIVNVAIGSIIEPRFMGQRLGLSALVVFLSLVFWGWVLGPVGMLLSVPLTMIVKIALQSNDDTQWLAIILGSVEFDDNYSTDVDPERENIE